MLLDIALEFDIKELDYWEMTPAEVNRAIKAKHKIRRIEAQERATYDYLQATLIVKGVSITLGSKESFPPIEEVYTGLFDDIKEKQEEQIKQRKMDLSALRFKQFAQSYNKNLKQKDVRAENE